MKNLKIIILSMKEVIVTYILQYLLIFALCAIYKLLGYKNLTHFISTYCVIFLLVFYSITIINLYQKNKIKEPRFKPNIKNMYFLISIGISIAIFLNMIIFKLTNHTNTRTIPLLLSIISSGIIGPIYEELLFRYIFLNRLKEHYSTKKSILINTTMFAIIHQNPIQMLYAFFLGLIINWFYDKYKNIIAPTIVHISANIIVLFLTGFNIYILLLSVLLFIIIIKILHKPLSLS